MNYTEKKYIKYKVKYIKLKNKQSSDDFFTTKNLSNNYTKNLENSQNGGVNIFDLNQKYSEYKKSELQKNLIHFKKKFGKFFQIKYNDIKINVILEQSKLHNGLSFNRITYDIPKRTTNLAPFIIDFIDPITGELNNNTIIVNIQKTDKISGNDMIKICLEINRILGADKTSLGDGTKVICNKNNEKMDLSYLKLIEKNMTFYMSHGFDFEIRDNIHYPYRFTDKTKLKEEINRLINEIRNIKTKNIIKEYENTITLLNLVLKNNDEKNLEIILDTSNPTNLNLIMYKENPNIKELMNESIEILKILYKYQNINLLYNILVKYYIINLYFDIYINLLYNILVKLFKDSCNEYTILHKFLIMNNRLKIIYKNKIIKRDYIKNFLYLSKYRDLYAYTYEF